MPSKKEQLTPKIVFQLKEVQDLILIEFIYLLLNIKMIRDVKEIEESTLWQQTGRQLAARGKNDEQDTRKIVVIVLGDKSSGKSTIIKQLRNDFDPDTKPNSLIQYWPSKVGLDRKQLIHFYQLGSPELAPFFEEFCREGTRIYFLLCVDLTHGSRMIANTTLLLQKVRDVCGKRKSEPQDQQQRRMNHPDTQIIKPLPAYVSIVGTKFDQFEKLDMQSKKWINRSLRYLALTNSCSLLASSNKINQFGLQLRTAFNDLLTKNELNTKPNFKDTSKPIFAVFGEDKIQDLNLPSSGNMTDLEVLAKHLESTSKSETKGEEKKEKAVIKTGGKLTDALQKKRNELIKMLKKGAKEAKEDIELV